MAEIRFGGRCDRHPLNIMPCVQCQAEAIVERNKARTFVGWALPEQIADDVDRLGSKTLFVSAEWQPGRVALYAEKGTPQ